MLVSKQNTLSVLSKLKLWNMSPATHKRQGDKFERYWRPLFGYIISLSWLMHMSTMCWVVWSSDPQAEKIIMAFVETTSLWSVALGVMGISVVKESQPRGQRRVSEQKHK